MPRPRLLLAPTLLLLASLLPQPCHAQAVVEVVNAQGAKAPCIGIGLGMLVEKKCISMTEKAGFLRTSELGDPGFTVGTTGADDGVITAVTPGGPAAAAGLLPGDIIRAVDGQAAQRSPANIVEELAYGPIEDPVHLTIRRAGATQDLTFARIKRDPPPNLPHGSMFLAIRNLINWYGQSVPCMGAGVEAMAPAIVICTNHFKPYSFVPQSKYASTGFTLDPQRPGAAIVSAVAPDSPAAHAGLVPGDEIVAVSGKPLTASTGDHVRFLLFGKQGDVRHLTIERNGTSKEVSLTLAKKA